jgi:hypothetical protein
VHAIAQFEIVEVFDVSRCEFIEFFNRFGRIQHHATGNHAGHTRGEHPTGEQRELVDFAPHDDGMTGVRSALIANDDIVVAGQEVDDFTFGFVAPLKSDDASPRHSTILQK